uniref:Ion_trans_2 domain-containing protein n=1 Tax=Mesocestoides corti TaxID=53468 RepID=A0A5K3EQK7_MESCO
MRKVQSWHNPSAFYRFEGIQDWYCDHLQRTPPCTHSVSNKSDAPRIELPIDPPELSGHREYWSKLKAFFKQRYVRFLILLLSYVCFLCIGAVCFRFLEQPGEQQVDKLSGEVVDLISNCHCFSTENLRNVLSELSTVPSTTLRNILCEANRKKKLSQKKGPTKCSPKVGPRHESEPAIKSVWDFGNSLLFCTTVVTTIGYGHIVPQTQMGKVFCIFFACIGIPFTLYLSSRACSLMIPLILRWRECMVRWSVNRSSLGQVVSVTNFPHIRPSSTRMSDRFCNSDLDGDLMIRGSIGSSSANIRVNPQKELTEGYSRHSLMPSSMGSVTHFFHESYVSAQPDWLKSRRRSKSLNTIYSNSDTPTSGIMDKFGKQATRQASHRMYRRHGTANENGIHKITPSFQKRTTRQKRVSTMSKASMLLGLRSRQVDFFQNQ